VVEALECLGGNGYVEESILARLYREAPVNSVWEGSGNVICLDVLRAIAREPDALGALLDEAALSRGEDARLDRALDRLRPALAATDEVEQRARHLVEQLALVTSAALLLRHAPAVVASTFCAARLGDAVGRQFGTLPPGQDLGAICERARPKLDSCPPS
jgi:putative acyl-CoA dehydrogenase